jgi:hypothetical protein
MYQIYELIYLSIYEARTYRYCRKIFRVSDELFAKLLGKESYKQETVEREGV